MSNAAAPDSSKSSRPHIAPSARFARLDMAALKLPCRSLLVAAEQKPAVHAGHDDDVFIPFKAAQRIGFANHRCASCIRRIPYHSAASAAHVKPRQEPITARPTDLRLDMGTIRASIVPHRTGSNVAASQFGASSQTLRDILPENRRALYPQTATYTALSDGFIELNIPCSFCCFQAGEILIFRLPPPTGVAKPAAPPFISHFVTHSPPPGELSM